MMWGFWLSDSKKNEEYYNHQPVFTEKINNDSYGYLKVKLSNGDCWCIGYIGQVQKIDEEYM